jgi:protocatechuate 4,5-dioxygenase beta chain
MDDLASNPERLKRIPFVEYVRETGAEGIEMVMWLIMRGALGEKAKEVYRHYHVPASNTAAGLIILDPVAGAVKSKPRAAAKRKKSRSAARRKRAPRGAATKRHSRR